MSTGIDLISLRQRADSGDSAAQCELAIYLHNGTHNVTRDYSEALIWFRNAADHGYAYATDWLGQMYADGEGVQRDITQAHVWYRKAATQYQPWADNGDVNSQFRLAFYYKEALGVPQDFLQALKWFRKAADQGHTGSQNYLGIMYHDGLGVPQDFSVALSWFQKAAELGNTNSQTRLAQMYERGEGVPQDYEIARQWLGKAAEGGNDEAKSRLAGLELVKQVAELEKSLRSANSVLEETANRMRDSLGKARTEQLGGKLHSNASSRSTTHSQTLLTAEEMTLLNAFRQIAEDGAVLACRLFCQEAGTSDFDTVKPETMLTADALKVIYSVAQATSEPISGKHGRLFLLIGQVVDPITFNKLSIAECSSLFGELNEEPPDGLWQPMILRILAHDDEQNRSQSAEPPRRGFQLLVSAAAGLSTSVGERERVTERYNDLLGLLAGNARDELNAVINETEDNLARLHLKSEQNRANWESFDPAVKEMSDQQARGTWESLDPQVKELIANGQNPYSQTPATGISEEQKFYRTVNRVVDENSTTIKLGLAYGKYRFWKAVWTSKPAQLVLLLILVGIFWLFGFYKSPGPSEVTTQPSALQEPQASLPQDQPEANPAPADASAAPPMPTDPGLNLSNPPEQPESGEDGVLTQSAPTPGQQQAPGTESPAGFTPLSASSDAAATAPNGKFSSGGLTGTEDRMQRIRTLLSRWTSSFEARDLSAQVNCYAPVVETYYLRHNVPQSYVETDKSRAFKAITEIHSFDIQEITFEALSDTRATVKFKKSWDTELVSGKTYAGQEIEELEFANIEGDWKIAAEKELQILWVKRE